MASFLNGQTSSASFIQQNQNIPTGNLDLTGQLSSSSVLTDLVLAGTDPLTIQGNLYVTGNISAFGSLSSSSAYTAFPSLDVDYELKTRNLSRDASVTISASGNQDISIGDFTTGSIVRTGFTSNSTVTDTLPFGTALIASLVDPKVGSYYDCLIYVDRPTGVEDVSYVLQTPADAQRAPGTPYQFFFHHKPRVLWVRLTVISTITPGPYYESRIIDMASTPMPEFRSILLQDTVPDITLKSPDTGKTLTLQVDPVDAVNYIDSVSQPLRVVTQTGTFDFKADGEFQASSMKAQTVTADSLLMNPTNPGVSAIALQPQPTNFANSCLYINTIRGTSNDYAYIDCRASNNGTTVFQVRGQGNLSTIGTGSFTGAVTAGGLTVTGSTYQRGAQFTKTTIVIESGNTTRTYTPAEVVNTIIERTLPASGPTINCIDRFPTAANLVSTYGLAVGDTFTTMLKADNQNATYTLTVAASTSGGSFVGFGTVPVNGKFMQVYRTVITNATPGAEAYTIYRQSVNSAAF